MELEHRAAAIREIAEELLGLAENVQQFTTSGSKPLKGWVQERGPRAKDDVPDHFVRVSNKGRLGASKGKPAEDTGPTGAWRSATSSITR